MTRIIHSNWFHHLVRILRLQRVSRKLLGVLPPTFRHNGIVYRIRSPETFSIAAEIFNRGTYDLLLTQVVIDTVMDLGCNTGFFTCLLASRYGRTNIKGILVDADPDVIAECEWHLEANHLDNCKTLCAVVGPASSKETDFYIAEFNISSSTRPFDESFPFPLPRTLKKTSRQTVTLEDLITTTFGDTRVNVLKVDIEGSELELLAQNLSCLGQVDWVIIEWHKWVIKLEDVSTRLSKYDFTLISILKEDSICGLALFENDKSPNKSLQRTS